MAGQYLHRLVELAKMDLRAGHYAGAVAWLTQALAPSYPINIGEGKLPGAQENDAHYWLGCAYQGLGYAALARQAWQQAAQAFNTATPHQVAPARTSFTAKPGETALEMTLPLGEAAQLWDEFHPALYQLTATLSPKKALADEQRTSFGLREMKAQGNRLLVNGRPVFLRGDLHSGEFPLTGYPATDVPSWLRVLGIMKAHGFTCASIRDARPRRPLRRPTSWAFTSSPKARAGPTTASHWAMAAWPWCSKPA